MSAPNGSRNLRVAPDDDVARSIERNGRLSPFAGKRDGRIVEHLAVRVDAPGDDAFQGRRANAEERRSVAGDVDDVEWQARFIEQLARSADPASSASRPDDEVRVAGARDAG
jgi:hypothetical protein